MLDERSIYLRKLILRAMRSGKRGHWGSSASLVEIMRVLYDDVAKQNPKNPKDPSRDRIILSKGHGVLAQACLLADRGFFPLDWLDKFCHKDGHIGGHPSPDSLPGVECHTGALGHGLPLALGMALAAKIKKESHRIFVILGDGELNEGSCWEAFMAIAKCRPNNMTIIIDHNKLQSAGFVEDIQPLGDLREKILSFGLSCSEYDGHNIERLTEELSIVWPFDRVVIAHTIKGKGIPFTEGNPMWHYKGSLTEEQIKEMEAALDDTDGGTK